jgi:hypothetical protein
MSTVFDALVESSLSPMLDAAFGEAVTVQRGTNTTSGVIASWTDQQETLVSPDGLHTQIVDRTWLVRKSRYLISGSAATPRTADTLTDAAGNVYEILPSTAGPAVTSYAGGFEWEIKTKKVS